MSKVIFIANSKGGVGKSTLSLLLYQYLAANGGNVAIQDRDPQKSIERLVDRLELDIQLTDRMDGYDYIIVDTPPYRQVSDVFQGADFVLIPVKASPMDADASQEIIEEVVNSGIPGAVVLNQVIAGTGFTKQVRDLLETFPLPVLRTEIGNRVGYARSLLTGTIESEENNKANREISSMAIEILTLMLNGKK